MNGAECVHHPDVDFFPTGPSGCGPALAVCAACPVRQQCLDTELARMARDGIRSTHGILGGTTAKQRTAMIRAENGATRRPLPSPIDHGTYGGARQHQRRGEELCVACRDAFRAHRRARQAEQRAKIAHGTWDGWLGHVWRGRRPCAVCAAVLDTSVMRELRAAALADSWRLRDALTGGSTTKGGHRMTMTNDTRDADQPKRLGICVQFSRAATGEIEEVA